MVLKALSDRTRRHPKRVPLRLVLVVPFTLQVIVAVGLTGWLSFRNGQQAVNDVVNRLHSEITNHIEERLRNYLETPHLINQINEDAIKLGQIDVSNADGLARHFWQQLQRFNGAYNIYFGNPEGGIILAGRGENGSFTIRQTEGTGSGRYITYAADRQGYRGEILATKPYFDSRMRPWFRESVKAGDRRWSEIYPFFTTMALGISASQPVYDTTGHLKGVLATDLMLQQLVDFLRSLKIGRSGQAFIIERSGYIVATSTSETPVLSAKDGKEVERLQASKSDAPLIRLTVQHLREQFGDLHNIAQAEELKVKIGQNQQFLQVTPYQDKRGLDWLIVVAIPEDDFIAQINANTRTTILLCLTALLVTIAIGILTANWISRPIWRLSEASRAIAQQAQQSDLSDVDLEQQVKIGNIVELAVLAESFNKMTHQLQESFTALEATNDELEERVEQRTAALRLSEEKFAIAFRASPDIITITGLENGKIIEVNDSFLRATGYRRDEVMGRTTIELNSWVDLEDRERMTHLLQTQGFVRNQEYDFRIKSGEIRIGLFSAEIINIGGQACLLSIINDITERKQMEQALRSEQEKSERLLLNILPERVAQQLKQSQGHLRDDAIAEFFEEVTILFADIVGFAPLASRMPPIELVNLLNQVFSSFDQLARHHGLEKIKTIGDAYMVTGGLPVPRADHAEAIAEMALDMQYAISKFQTDRGVPFQIRIGINTGSVVAGVIGINRFTYDLWGDTVNVASRMESHGEAGRIQVTAATYERLRERFVLEERGIISIKGKEEKMQTYWLKARKCQEMAS